MCNNISKIRKIWFVSKLQIFSPAGNYASPGKGGGSGQYGVLGREITHLTIIKYEIPNISRGWIWCFRRNHYQIENLQLLGGGIFWSSGGYSPRTTPLINRWYFIITDDTSYEELAIDLLIICTLQCQMLEKFTRLSVLKFKAFL